eukprot:40209-Eustigmatos_ZCMA.PRE.1
MPQIKPCLTISFSTPPPPAAGRRVALPELLPADIQGVDQDVVAAGLQVDEDGTATSFLPFRNRHIRQFGDEASGGGVRGMKMTGRSYASY